MNRIILLLLSLMLLIACNTKKESKPAVPAANFFVNDYIKGQVARLDTALFSFIKIETMDGRSDSMPIKNSDVRFYASDFLKLPDLAAAAIKDDYEVSHLYDELQNAFIFTYTTKENHPVREQHLTVEPEISPEGKSNIRSVYIDYWDSKGDTAIRKNMMWQANSFYITTTTEAPGQLQKIKTVKIIWNAFESQNK